MTSYDIFCPTTKGWEFQVQWNDGTSPWVPLKDMKESNLIEVAEYATARSGIQLEPAFIWWIPNMLHKHDQIIALQ